MNILRLALIAAATLVFGGCSTTASKERLEKQNQLLQLELENRDHALKAARSEIDQLKIQLEKADQKLEDLTQSGDDKAKAFELTKKNLAFFQLKHSECQVLLADLKEHLEKGKLSSRSTRQDFLNRIKAWSESEQNAPSQRPGVGN